MDGTIDFQIKFITESSILANELPNRNQLFDQKLLFIVTFKYKWKNYFYGCFRSNEKMM